MESALLARGGGDLEVFPAARGGLRPMTSTLGLYRQLLRVTAVWPSSNRGKIMQEIRAGVPPLISLYARP